MAIFGIEHATFRLVAQFLIQLRHRVLQLQQYKWWYILQLYFRFEIAIKGKIVHIVLKKVHSAWKV
jgi:hypothetical protein